MRWLAALVLLACLPLTVQAGEKRIVAYFTEWSIYARKYHVGDIRADRLTHLVYAFAKIDARGEVAIVDSYAASDRFYPGDRWDAGYLRGNFGQLRKLKARHPHLKTLIAVGGWSLSGPFSDTALTAGSRQRFARSAVAFMTRYGFDGVDIDWEYPVSGGLASNRTRPADRENCTLLLAELRKQLDARGKADGKRYLLTMAAPAGPKTLANIELGKVAKLLDWFNLMSYDFHGGWSSLTHFNAPLYPIRDDPSTDETVRKRFNADAAVRAYRAAGVPADRIVLGVPFYGRGWQGVKKAGNGLFQKPGPGLPKGTWEPGVFDYRDLVVNYIGKYRRFRHPEAKVPWLYDDNSGVMISYDDAESLKIKAEYVRKHDLGGVMAWELSADDARATLLGTLHEVLRRKK